MSRSVIVSLLAVLIIGCVGQGGMFGPGSFEMRAADTRFTEHKNHLFVSSNNRISSKSIAGGIHIDGSGVYINPAVMKSRDTGEVLSLGLNISNVTSHDTQYGSPNSLGVMEQITFLLDDTDTLILPIRDADVRWGEAINYNKVTRTASSNILESGTAFLSPQQYQRILSANSVAVQLAGSKRSVVYEAGEISDSFIPNLRLFFQEHVISWQ